MNRSLKGLLFAAGAIAVPAAVNAYLTARAGTMEQPLPGDIAYYDWIYGKVAYYRLGQGTPLLLVHTPNAGGCAWEWRKVFPELANHFTVYAIDLLGFGLSEKPDIAYSGRMYAELLHDFLQDVIEQRADAIGSTLSAAYLVNVAVRRPESLNKLILVNPTGVTNVALAPVQSVTHGILDAPVLGTSIYHSIVSQRGIARELCEHIYYDSSFITPELVQFLYTASHQPGSHHAVAAFIAGTLDLPMRLAFTDLTQPTLLVWGRDAYYTPVGDAADLLYRNPGARLEIFDECGMLPHDEKAGEFLRLARRSWRKRRRERWRRDGDKGLSEPGFVGLKDWLADYRDPRVHCSREDLIKALTGEYREAEIFVLAQILAQYDFLHQQVKPPQAA